MTSIFANGEPAFELRSRDGVRLFTRRWAPEESVDAEIGIVHGIGEHSGRYEEVGRWLCGEGFRVSSFDQRGHGQSPGRRGDARTYELLLDDLQFFVEHLTKTSDSGKVFLYGHSLGGNIVLNYAIRRQPDLSGLIVTSPLLRQTHRAVFWKRVAANLCYRLCPAVSLPTGIDLEGLSRDREVLAACRNDKLVHGKISARLAVESLAAGEWALQHAGELTLPLLLMHGSCDSITSPQASIRFAEKARSSCLFKLWEGLFHELHNEPEKYDVLELIAGWIRSCLMTPQAPNQKPGM